MEKAAPKWLIALAVAIGFAACVIVKRVEAGPNKAQQAKTLNLQAPITVAGVGEFRDGGTVSFHLVDATGRKAAFCFDFKSGSKTPGRLYMGAEHPSRPGAKLVPLRSQTEKAVLQILQSFLDRQFSRSEQKTIATLSGGEVYQRYSDKGTKARLLLRGISRLQALSAQKPGSA